MGLAPLIAPVLGSQILLFAGWRTIFWALGLFAVLCALGAVAILPETLPPPQRRRGSFFAMLRSYVEPATNRAYLAYAFSGALIFAGLFAYIAGSPFVFITYFGLEPQHYALLFGANALGIMAMSATNGRLVPRIGVDRMLAFGIGLAAVAGMLLLASVALGRGGALAVIVPLFFFVCSIGMVGANAMAGGLALFPDRAGVASALAGTLQFLTGAVGASLVSAFSDGTPLPMAAVIAGAGILSLFARRTL
jgi:DHA1 family bicyclomycin/chloramphenicol resistance-like MFS transporter